jgi:hypothetical protein
LHIKIDYYFHDAKIMFVVCIKYVLQCRGGDGHCGF